MKTNRWRFAKGSMAKKQMVRGKLIDIIVTPTGEGWEWQAKVQSEPHKWAAMTEPKLCPTSALAVAEAEHYINQLKKRK